MKYLKFKDNKFRKKFKYFEYIYKLKLFLYKNILSFLYKNSFSINYKKMLFFQILKKRKKNFLTKIVRRCIITNRSKTIRPFKISRLLAREMIGFGIIPGYKKAVW
jgi:ribosomal protein S14